MPACKFRSSYVPLRKDVRREDGVARDGLEKDAEKSVAVLVFVFVFVFVVAIAGGIAIGTVDDVAPLQSDGIDQGCELCGAALAAAAPDARHGVAGQAGEEGGNARVRVVAPVPMRAETATDAVLDRLQYLHLVELDVSLDQGGALRLAVLREHVALPIFVCDRGIRVLSLGDPHEIVRLVGGEEALDVDDEGILRKMRVRNAFSGHVLAYLSRICSTADGSVRLFKPRPPPPPRLLSLFREKMS